MSSLFERKIKSSLKDSLAQRRNKFDQRGLV
jgi:hypothetical protein